MFLKPKLSPLPPQDRRRDLQTFLAALNSSPNLVDFRAHVVSPEDRQLAFFAALERAVLVGSPAAMPPKPDDHADMLLCDILDCLDSNPDVARRCSAYGPDRHLANLQSLGAWRGRKPLATPSALELFTTTFAALSASHDNNLPSCNLNLSPLPPDSAPNGDLIDSSLPSSSLTPSSQSALQVIVIPELTDKEPLLREAGLPVNSVRINHHEPTSSGEQCNSQEAAQEIIPARPIRRGRPPVLDDLAKGRLLGLMAYGLSFRQAAAQLGIHHVTILSTMKRDELFAQQVSEARLDAISQPLITIVRASRTSWRAAAWLAKFLDDRRARNPESTPEERTLFPSSAASTHPPTSPLYR